MTTRKPAVAGQFYPGSRPKIEEQIASLVEEGRPREKVLGAMGPHAGWFYSGRGAGILYSRVELPETVVILCPNHRGQGEEMAVMSEGWWELPTGAVELEGRLSRLVKDRCPSLKEDARAHQFEHSLEVHLPFLQHFRPDFKLVPISLGRLGYEDCEELGKALAAAVVEYGQEVLVVASSDMTHFESAESARQKDQLALDRMLDLDPDGLYYTVMNKRISMCGVIPATVMLICAIERGATEARLLDYRNSGDVTGDHSDVVAYATLIVK